MFICAMRFFKVTTIITEDEDDALIQDNCT